MAERRMARRTPVAWILIIATAMTSLGLVQPAAAGSQAPRIVRYKDTGLDPDDVPVDRTSCCQQDPDIRSTTRKVWVDVRNQPWLTISFGTYDALDDYWEVRVKLDARGGPRYDATMSIFDPGTGPEGCSFLRRGSTRRDARFRLKIDQAFCRLPLGWVGPTKRIRWRLFSRGGGEGSGPAIDEHAPDTGWYV
jgi:hypothetical protein